MNIEWTIFLNEVVKKISTIDPFLAFDLQALDNLKDIANLAVTLVKRKKVGNTMVEHPIDIFDLKLKNIISKISFKVSLFFWLKYKLYEWEQKKTEVFSLIK